MAKQNGDHNNTIDPLNPADYQDILGKTYVTQQHTPLITVAGRSWNKWELGLIGCPHPSAAREVNRVLQTMNIKTPEQFVENVPQFGGFEGMGTACYEVVLGLARSFGYEPREAHGGTESFGARHRRALKDRAATRKGRRRRSPR